MFINIEDGAQYFGEFEVYNEIIDQFVKLTAVGYYIGRIPDSIAMHQFYLTRTLNCVQQKNINAMVFKKHCGYTTDILINDKGGGPVAARVRYNVTNDALYSLLGGVFKISFSAFIDVITEAKIYGYLTWCPKDEPVDVRHLNFIFGNPDDLSQAGMKFKKNSRTKI